MADGASGPDPETGQDGGGAPVTPVVDWRREAEAAHARLAALDAATIAISQEVSLERVLQLIVDSVRPLVGARYAALGIPDDIGHMERFITSGISEQERLAIGPPPRGLGLLGEIISEGRTLRLAELSEHPRSAGFPPNHPVMHSFLGVPVRVEGRTVGNLYLTDKAATPEAPDGSPMPFSEDDERLVETFARHAGLAIHNARMHEDLRQMAVLQERERIAQDLHDGTIQSLYAVGLSLEDAAESIATDPRGVAERIDHSIEAIHGTIREIRDFIMGLDPDAQAAVDLLGGLAALADEFERSNLIEVDLEGDPGSAFDAELSRQLIQLTREAMSNVARHAGATRVRVRVEDRRDVLRLTIIDDGQGFDPEAESVPGHHGLANMRARAEALGGSLTISSASGRGTQVTFERPRAESA